MMKLKKGNAEINRIFNGKAIGRVNGGIEVVTNIELDIDEKELLEGKPPKDNWKKDTIEAYLKHKKIKYNKSDKKSDLLKKTKVQDKQKAQKGKK